MTTVSFRRPSPVHLRGFAFGLLALLPLGGLDSAIFKVCAAALLLIARDTRAPDTGIGP